MRTASTAHAVRSAFYYCATCGFMNPADVTALRCKSAWLDLAAGWCEVHSQQAYFRPFSPPENARTQPGTSAQRHRNAGDVPDRHERQCRFRAMKGVNHRPGDAAERACTGAGPAWMCGCELPQRKEHRSKNRYREQHDDHRSHLPRLTPDQRRSCLRRRRRIRCQRQRPQQYKRRCHGDSTDPRCRAWTGQTGQGRKAGYGLHAGSVAQRRSRCRT